jgi:hypothetical protein
VATKCNVVSWDDQLSLFEFAFEKYGAVDIVVCILLSTASARFIRIMLTVIDPKRRNHRNRTWYMCGKSQIRGWQARRAQAGDPGGQPNRRFLQ